MEGIAFLIGTIVIAICTIAVGALFLKGDDNETR